mgnify:CR=1 FL=1
MSTCFIDTTTLLYPMDSREPVKRVKAAAWLKRLRDSDQLILSPQILNEGYWVLRRKSEFNVPLAQARAYVSTFMSWVRAPMTAAQTRTAWEIEERHGVRFWDALILASANAAGCAYFVSEDLNDGQAYGGVVAINPFRHAPEDVLGPSAR